MPKNLTKHKKLVVIKTIHTIIYLMMVIAIFYILFAAITKSYGFLLNFSLVLLAVECVIFLGFGMKCPLTDLAKRYGDSKGYVGDTFFPERYTKYSFRVFGTIFFIGLLILLMDILSLR